MPDTRKHRGPHPQDEKLFSAAQIKIIRCALKDFSLLMTKGYAQKSALKLVGDKFELTQRQRLAIMRSACSDQQLQSRKKREIHFEELAGGNIAIDGYNVLITVEAAMSNAAVFKGRDGCLRDLAGIHGTYRKVTETVPALMLIGEFLHSTGCENVLCTLDSPVSNSARLKSIIYEKTALAGWNWNVKLSINPDAELIAGSRPVASTDAVVIDKCRKWVNLARAIIEQKLPHTWLIDLSDQPDTAH